jgi:signal transduction histidine kinase
VAHAYDSRVTINLFEPLDAARHDVMSVAATAERFPLSARDIAFMVGFWTIYALLNIGNDLFGPRGGGSSGALLSAWIIVSVQEAALWALLTPFIVLLAARAGTWRSSRLVHFTVLLLVGIALALGVGLVGQAVRGAVFTPPPGSNPNRPHGPPLWFGFINALVIYLGVLAAGFARAYSLRFRARREQATQLQAQLAEARLEALRRQIDPHFLFNTLNAVSSLVERDPRGVRRMIARLSELLRFSMEGAREPEITLRRELSLLDRYLDIMQLRFQGRLEVIRRVDDAALDVMVPSMVLQPLVENAIKHGVEKMTGPGRIDLDAQLEDDALVLRVTDNGPGWTAGTSPMRDGIGLRNTAARIAQLYGDAARFTLSRRADGTTVAELRVPARRGAELRVQGVDMIESERPHVR